MKHNTVFSLAKPNNETKLSFSSRFIILLTCAVTYLKLVRNKLEQIYPKRFLEAPFAFLFAFHNLLIEEEIIQGLFPRACSQKDQPLFLICYLEAQGYSLEFYQNPQSEIPEFYLAIVIMIIFLILTQGHA